MSAPLAMASAFRTTFSRGASPFGQELARTLTLNSGPGELTFGPNSQRHSLIETAIVEPSRICATGLMCRYLNPLVGLTAFHRPLQILNKMKPM